MEMQQDLCPQAKQIFRLFIEMVSVELQAGFCYQNANWANWIETDATLGTVKAG